MQDLIIKSADFVSTPDEEQPFLRTVLLDLPENRGTLFALIRILGPKNEKKQRLSDAIEDHLKRLQDTLGEQINVPRRFEQVLQAINEDIERISLEGPKIPMTDFHAVLGVVHKNQIFFSGVGSLYTLFMHKSAKQRYVLYELSDQYRSEDGPSWDKPFVTILDGEMGHGDIFYLATRVSAREISIADLQDTLVTLPPGGALKRIQQHLHTDTAYGAICFHMADKPVKGPPMKVNPLSSIEQFGQTQDDTAELLGEQSPDVSNFLHKIANPILKSLSSPGTRGTKSTLKNMLRFLIKSAVVVFTFLGQILRSLGQLIGKFAKKLFSLIRDEEKRTAVRDVTKDTIKRSKSFVQHLPKAVKISAAAIGVVLVIVVIGLSVNGKQKARRETNETFQIVVERVQENTDAASASLIYNDNTQARQLLEEALALIETLPPEHKDYQQTVDELRNEINLVYEELRGIEQVDTTILADLGNIDPAESFTSLVSVDGVIFGSSMSGKLYRFNELERQLVQVDASRGAVGTVEQASAYTGGFIFLDSNQRIGRADTVANTLNPIVSGAENLQSAEDIEAYNGNAYILSANAQQIVKMQPQADGFDAGTSWISSQNQDISTARSLTIDGDIYILTQNTIVKYSSGVEQPFAVDTIDPAMTNPVSITTTLASEYLYVLDPGANRVLIFRKSGELVTQYVNDTFADGVEIFIQEDKNTIIIGTKTQLLSFTTPHLLQ